MRLDDALAQCPVVAILRGVRPEEVVAIARATFEAGVRAVEVPLNSPDPFESLRRLTGEFQAAMACGAGTVLSPEDVDRAADAGARLIIAPNTNPAVVRRAVALGLEPAPGFASASEAFEAISAGARHLKLFPAVTYGPQHLRQLKAVLPGSAVIWAVGGIGPADLADWWAAGARAFVIGSEIYRASQDAAQTRGKALALVEAARRLNP